jgi:prepilin-type N-terminal cleavage/methylation domain-containing protein
VTGRRRGRGFTLIELLVVMSIIAVLLTIAVPRYFKTLERSRETVLRQDLSVMREAIDKHFGDYGQYPDSLAALVERRYIRAVPTDPITKSADGWQVVVSDDADHPGIKDVHSSAEGNATDGTPYKEW